MFKLQELIRRDIVSVLGLESSSSLLSKSTVDWAMKISLFLFQDKLALNITTEQGKTLKDAHGDVFRGLG